MRQHDRAPAAPAAADPRGVLLDVIGCLDDDGAASLVSFLDVVFSAPAGAVEIVGKIAQHVLEQHEHEHEHEHEADDGICEFGCGQVVDHDLRECPAFQAEIAAAKREEQARRQQLLLEDRAALAADIVRLSGPLRRQPPPRAPRAAAGPPAPWVADAMTAGGMLTVKEACDLLRKSRRTLYRLIDAGRLQAIKQGVAGSSRLLILRSSIASYLESLDS